MADVTDATATQHEPPNAPSPAAAPRDNEIKAEERASWADEDEAAQYRECGCFPEGFMGGSLFIKNEGSTARDYLARERNWLTWVRLSVTLSVISAALFLRFQFGATLGKIPKFELEAEMPLGILFFVAAGACLGVGVVTHFTYDRLMRQRTGFVHSGRGTQIVVWGVCGLTIAACILLLINDV